jgi:hypothetical protein
LTKLGFICKVRPKRFHKIDPRFVIYKLKERRSMPTPSLENHLMMEYEKTNLFRFVKLLSQPCPHRVMDSLLRDLGSNLGQAKFIAWIMALSWPTQYSIPRNRCPKLPCDWEVRGHSTCKEMPVIWLMGWWIRKE